MKWRKWNNIVHRDVGYLCIGLTLVYAISGVAVNHVADWNPNFDISTVTSSIGPVETVDREQGDVVTDVLARLNIEGEVRSSFRPEPEVLEIFLEGTTVAVHLTDGSASVETIASRTGLREMNFLHLNHPKKLWTLMADLYAVALATLAITGMFVLKGKKGIKGRGAWLTAAGVLIPVIFLWAYL